jgi:hypothetical protein
MVLLPCALLRLRLRLKVLRLERKVLPRLLG